MAVSLRSSQVALMTAGPGAAAELRHCWYAVLARSGDPVRLAGGDFAGSFPRQREADEMPADLDVADAVPSDYAGLVVVGGSDAIVTPVDGRRLALLAGFFEMGVPVAVCGLGMLHLLLARLVRGRRLTGPSQLRARLSAAGAIWADEPVVRCSRGPNVLITCGQGPRTLPAFCDAFTRAFAANAAAGRPGVLQQG
jgi:protease I